MSKISTAALLILLTLTACGDNRVGMQFESFGSILQDEAYAEWVSMGRFGPSGPFKVVAERNFIQGRRCIFQVGNQRHAYSPIPGHSFRVVHLQTEKGEESVMVLRTKHAMAATPR